MRRQILFVLIFLFLVTPVEAIGLRVAFVGDPQVDNEQELRYAQKSIYRELRERNDLDLVIILGDIVNDDTQWLAPSFASLDSLSCPWVCVPGNHDRNFYKKASSRYPGKALPHRERDLADYQKLNGYIDTTFTKKGVRFVCMNNVRTLKNGGYEGGFHPKQKQWIDSLLQNTPPRQSVVFCTHIPLSSSQGLDSLSTLLKRHENIYFVSGHTHSVLRHRVMNYEELIAGAACGSWWRGKKGSDGIPLATMRSGDPRGYFVADFCCGKWKKLHYKSIGNDSIASLTRRDGKIYINVFGGRQEAVVKIRAKKCGAKWMTMKRSEDTCEEIRQVLEHNQQIGKSKRSEKIPIRKNTRCLHLWEIQETLIPGNEVFLRYDDGLYKFEIQL